MRSNPTPAARCVAKELQMSKSMQVAFAAAVVFVLSTPAFAQGWSRSVPGQGTVVFTPASVAGSAKKAESPADVAKRAAACLAAGDIFGKDGVCRADPKKEKAACEAGGGTWDASKPTPSWQGAKDARCDLSAVNKDDTEDHLRVEFCNDPTSPSRLRSVYKEHKCTLWRLQRLQRGEKATREAESRRTSESLEALKKDLEAKIAEAKALADEGNRTAAEAVRLLEKLGTDVRGSEEACEKAQPTREDRLACAGLRGRVATLELTLYGAPECATDPQGEACKKAPGIVRVLHGINGRVGDLEDSAGRLQLGVGLRFGAGTQPAVRADVGGATYTFRGSDNLAFGLDVRLHVPSAAVGGIGVFSLGWSYHREDTHNVAGKSVGVGGHGLLVRAQHLWGVSQEWKLGAGATFAGHWTAQAHPNALGKVSAATPDLHFAALWQPIPHFVVTGDLGVGYDWASVVVNGAERTGNGLALAVRLGAGWMF